MKFNTGMELERKKKCYIGLQGTLDVDLEQ